MKERASLFSRLALSGLRVGPGVIQPCDQSCVARRSGYGAALFFEARVVAGNALFPRGGGDASAGLAFLLGREGPSDFPARQRRGGIHPDGMSVEVRQRRPHQIPDDQRERGGVAELHVCCLAGAASAVDHSQVSAQLARVGVASVGLTIGPLLVVEIAKDRSGASAALPR